MNTVWNYSAALRASSTPRMAAAALDRSHVVGVPQRVHTKAFDARFIAALVKVGIV